MLLSSVCYIHMQRQTNTSTHTIVWETWWILRSQPNPRVANTPCFVLDHLWILHCNDNHNTTSTIMISSPVCIALHNNQYLFKFSLIKLFHVNVQREIFRQWHHVCMRYNLCGKVLKWKILMNLVNRMPFAILLSANYFFL